MFIYLNDGRKVNMMWVMSYYQDNQNKKVVIYDMVKGQTLKIEEVFETEAEAEARIAELDENYVI